MDKIDNTPNPNAIETTVNINVPQRVVEITQRNDRFALKPDKVTFPFDGLKILAAQVVLIDAGMMQVAPAGTGGEGTKSSGASATH